MLLFEIHGKPIPQKQTKFARGGWAYDPSKKDLHQIQWQLKPYAPQEPLTGRLEIDYTFYMPIPKGTSAIKRRQMLNDVIGHTKRPDFDNLAYIITNAMKGIIYQDDSLIADAHIHKRWGDIGKTVIKIIPVAQIQPTRGEQCG